MSDKHKIYDYIKRTINPYGRPFEGTAYELGLKIMDYIENMDDEKENGWIPVSERLPEASGTYQVTCMDGRIHRSTYDVGIYIAEGNELACIKKAKRRNRTRPVSEILLMMFRSANRDYRKAVKQLEEMKKND